MSFRVRQTHTLINTPLKPKQDLPKKKDIEDDEQKVAAPTQPAHPVPSERLKGASASFGVRANFGGKSDYY